MVQFDVSLLTWEPKTRYWEVIPQTGVQSIELDTPAIHCWPSIAQPSTARQLITIQKLSIYLAHWFIKVRFIKLGTFFYSQINDVSVTLDMDCVQTYTMRFVQTYILRSSQSCVLTDSLPPCVRYPILSWSMPGHWLPLRKQEAIWHIDK